eukprot:TRINITY_DN8337_c0_g1_i1.p1 TRINITY_DN8337_c0_g1~~TRINITY_DN8337_c0_g1_i1.p1  ORF type:complete len:383 (+),score=97.51 TRINITY_DN8337_c0_g1_i1:120-1268(+)
MGSLHEGSEFVLPASGVRYKIDSLLGTGVTSRVYSCIAIPVGATGASADAAGAAAAAAQSGCLRLAPITLKVALPQPGRTALCAEEVETLVYLKQKWRQTRQPPEACPFAELLGWFNDAGAVCMAFAGGGVSLADVMAARSAGLQLQAWTLPEVRHIAHSLLSAVAFLQHSSGGLIHTDIKPSNIIVQHLSASPSQAADTHNDWFSKSGTVTAAGVVAVRLIDFGHATFDGDAEPVDVTVAAENGRGAVGTPQYRAPELQQGLPWGHGVDLWAVGCVLLKLCGAEQMLLPLPASAAETCHARSETGEQGAAAAAVAGPRARADAEAAVCAPRGSAHLLLLRLLGTLLSEDATLRSDANAVMAAHADSLMGAGGDGSSSSAVP